MSQDLKSLGSNVNYPTEPNISILEKVDNPHPNSKYLIKFTCPEFTSICPITSQPDFAHIVIEYVPKKFIIESKALKLYLFSFRNHGAFHEDCTVRIASEICKVIDPEWLRIAGYWYPRGGIPIDIFYQTGDKPAGVWIPDQDVPSYKGRG